MPRTFSTVAGRARPLIYSIFVWMMLLSIPLSAACGIVAEEKTPCDGLVYKDFGLTRAEYLPCVGEMLTTLERLRPQVDSMLTGDQEARAEAVDTFRHLQTLIKKAGGRNMTWEKWDDVGLMRLNHRIRDISGQYEVCLRYTNVVIAMASKERSAKKREEILAQCTYPGKSVREVRSDFRYLK
jgi:hypothetical protein